MNTTYRPESTTQHNLKKWAARAFLAGGVSLAVMGLGAGTANALPGWVDPLPPGWAHQHVTLASKCIGKKCQSGPPKAPQSPPSGGNVSGGGGIDFM
jgi:hypothetical protein